jgi:hypothetical protein
VYRALYRVDDWLAVVELMRTIRDTHRKLDDQEREARKQ